MRTIHAAILVALAGACAAGGAASGQVVRVGRGSYATELPPGAKEPQPTIYKTAAVTGAMPTNDWWSSLAWVRYSERHYPHPLAVQAQKGGLRVYYPGPGIRSTRDAIFGFMPAGGGDDFVIGHSAQGEFPDARVDGFSDWFVRVLFAAGPRRMTVSYGHGSPFVYASYEGGTARVTFARAPKVWAGGESEAALGVSVGRRHYGLFGPTGSTWEGLGGRTLTNRAGAKRYFSAAVLPVATEEALALFRKCAHAHVTDTKVAWEYGPATGTVTTTYTFALRRHEGGAAGTLFALYPHQWRHTDAKLLEAGYDSVRGRMKLARGAALTTRMKFPGVLPSLPDAGGCDKARLARYVALDARRAQPGTKDTYWEGKHLGKLAALAPIAEQSGPPGAAEALRTALKARLEGWFTAAGRDGRAKRRGLFYYNRAWGTLIGYPASYASDTQLNDHHFHYGYFIKAAAEIARRDRAWSAPDRWGGMVKLLIRDVACADRADPMFPFLRSFDPYAGHSWASGHAKFGDGNNNESSSEAMNAWCAMILWGQAAGDRRVRDLGIYLHTTEMSAIGEYWFDTRDENHPKDYTPSVVTMIWGGKGANGTWFSAKPEAVHGINFLPIHGGSLYLGHDPAYVRKNYAAMVRENKGDRWDQWADILWMFLALADPDEAMKQFEAARDNYPAEGGNTKANTYHWLGNLRVLGRVDPTVTADYPLYAVFRKGGRRTYAVYNTSPKPQTVRFSDGFTLQAKTGGFAVGRRDVGAARTPPASLRRAGL